MNIKVTSLVIMLVSLFEYAKDLRVPKSPTSNFGSYTQGKSIFPFINIIHLNYHLIVVVQFSFRLEK